jgi:hypothetical protein
VYGISTLVKGSHDVIEEKLVVLVCRLFETAIKDNLGCDISGILQAHFAKTDDGHRGLAVQYFITVGAIGYIHHVPGGGDDDGVAYCIHILRCVDESGQLGVDSDQGAAYDVRLVVYSRVVNRYKVSIATASVNVAYLAIDVGNTTGKVV